MEIINKRTTISWNINFILYIEVKQNTISGNGGRRGYPFSDISDKGGRGVGKFLIMAFGVPNPTSY